MSQTKRFQPNLINGTIQECADLLLLFSCCHRSGFWAVATTPRLLKAPQVVPQARRVQRQPRALVGVVRRAEVLGNRAVQVAAVLGQRAQHKAVMRGHRARLAKVVLQVRRAHLVRAEAEDQPARRRAAVAPEQSAAQAEQAEQAQRRAQAGTLARAPWQGQAGQAQPEPWRAQVAQEQSAERPVLLGPRALQAARVQAVQVG